MVSATVRYALPAHTQHPKLQNPTLRAYRVSPVNIRQFVETLLPPNVFRVEQASTLS